MGLITLAVVLLFVEMSILSFSSLTVFLTGGAVGSLVSKYLHARKAIETPELHRPQPWEYVRNRDKRNIDDCPTFGLLILFYGYAFRQVAGFVWVAAS